MGIVSDGPVTVVFLLRVGVWGCECRMCRWLMLVDITARLSTDTAVLQSASISTYVVCIRLFILSCVCVLCGSKCPVAYVV